MSAQPLRDLWDAAAGQPYEPAIGKNSQFTVGFTLLLTALMLSGYFGLNPSLKNLPSSVFRRRSLLGRRMADAELRTFSLRVARLGAVYMICAVGVYV
ncbi:hypothetical protein H2203_002663 [Taxawa tesnikishii (nom. ined.)]|nr:hypothetical protein H2203_002663 [Dothideales sp. JES 119]